MMESIYWDKFVTTWIVRGGTWWYADHPALLSCLLIWVGRWILIYES